MTSNGGESQANQLFDSTTANEHKIEAAVRQRDERDSGNDIVAREKAQLAGSEDAANTKNKAGTGPGWSGIAFSGGGIRSSSFCTGVIQGLAADNRLKDFDYLSTVSGGGFIGSSLRWWWHGAHKVEDENGKPVEFGTEPKDFPYGTSDPRDPLATGDNAAQKANLHYLRNHGYYLTPGNGITVWSGVAVVVRTIMLNLLVWIPIAIGLFYLMWLFQADWWATSWIFKHVSSPLPSAVIEPRWELVAGEVIDKIHRFGEVDGKAFYNVLSLPPLFGLMIWGAYGLLAFYVVGGVFYSIQTSRTRGSGGSKFTSAHWKWVGVGIALLAGGIFLKYLLEHHGITWVWFLALAYGLMFFGVAILARMYLIWARQDATDVSEDEKWMSHAYILRRFFETTVSALFKYLVVFLILGAVPLVFMLAFTATGSPGFTGLASLAGGVAAALSTHVRMLKSLPSGLTEKIVMPIGAGLFLFGVIVLGYHLAMLLVETNILGAKIAAGTTTAGAISEGSDFTLISKTFSRLVFENLGPELAENISLVLAFFVLLAIACSTQVNTNQISLNRFYRDRLMEAYMPDAEAVKTGETLPTPADSLKLYQLWNGGHAGESEKTFRGPYPLINTNCVLINDDVHKVRLRGGDNYLLSPLFCGSNSTGWHETSGEACKMLTLPTAMATSGAAANPNAGYVGTGVTMNRLVSIVMMLLNIRLGLWIVNPSIPSFKKKPPRPTHLKPGALYSVTNAGFKRTSPFLELSDGGHFDNTAMYELLRRECQLIIACDGEADGNYAYPGFVSLQERAAQDFGVKFRFDKNYLPKDTIPSEEMKYPRGALHAERPFFVAEIIYDSKDEKGRPKTGLLIYIKSTMIDDLSFTTKGYKAQNPSFPHESTADQFFSPEQFEVYRELGYYSAKIMMEHVNKKWEVLSSKAGKRAAPESAITGE